MKDINSTIEKRLGQALQQRTASVRSGRFDLRLSDFKVSNSKREARVLVTYEKNLGTPTRKQLDEWVTASTHGRLILELESPRHYKDYGAIVAMVRSNELRRPLKHSQQMVKGAANQYMDKDKSVWEVQQSSSGERFLVRVADDDMDEILKARQRYERTASLHKRLRLADIKEAVSEMPLDVGDRISYMHRGILQRGEVTHVGEDGLIHVRKAAQDVLKVPRENVVDIFEKSPQAQKDRKQFLVDFFTRAYGDPEFAKTLVNK
jgi:hypothetical protein